MPKMNMEPADRNFRCKAFKWSSDADAPCKMEKSRRTKTAGRKWVYLSWHWL